MNILINDIPKKIDDGATIDDIIHSYAQQGPFAVALNGTFVPKAQYPQTQLKSNDSLEIVSPMQGG